MIPANRRQQHRSKWLLVAYTLLVLKSETALGFHSPHSAVHKNRLATPTTTNRETRVYSFVQPNRGGHARFQPPHQQPANTLAFSSPAIPTTTTTASRTQSLNYVSGSGFNDELAANLNVEWDQVWLPQQQQQESGEGSSAAHIPSVHNNLNNNNNNGSGPELSPMERVALGGSALTLAALFASLVAWSGDARFYLAGGICAAVSHLVPVPVDVVKTRKQVDPQLSDATFLQATHQIYQKEGLKSLFVGSGPTFWGYFFEGAIKFGIYEVLKPLVKQWIPWSQHVAFLVSAAISGLAASVMVCPMEALRIRLVAEPEYARLGWQNGGLQMLKKEGVSAFGKGLLPMIYKQVPYTMTKNVSFDVLTKLAYATMATTTTAAMAGRSAKLAVPLVCAAAASVLSCISSQPGDMLLSLVNAHGGAKRTHDVARDILKSERGARGFFVGIKTRFLHVGIIVTMQLMIYDMVKRLCGIAATGSV